MYVSTRVLLGDTACSPKAAIPASLLAVCISAIPLPVAYVVAISQLPTSTRLSCMYCLQAIHSSIQV